MDDVSLEKSATSGDENSGLVVHCFTDSVRLADWTVVSDVPCQSATRGLGPV